MKNISRDIPDMDYHEEYLNSYWEYREVMLRCLIPNHVSGDLQIMSKDTILVTMFKDGEMDVLIEVK